MIKHAIVYDDNKGILVVIMPVYAIEAAYLHHFGCNDESSKALTQFSAKCTYKRYDNGTPYDDKISLFV